MVKTSDEEANINMKVPGILVAQTYLRMSRHYLLSFVIF